MLCESLDFIRLRLHKMMIVISFCHPTKPGNVFSKVFLCREKQHFCFKDISAALPSQ